MSVLDGCQQRFRKPYPTRSTRQTTRERLCRACKYLLQNLHLYLQGRFIVRGQLGLVNDLHSPVGAIVQGRGALDRREATPAGAKWTNNSARE